MTGIKESMRTHGHRQTGSLCGWRGHTPPPSHTHTHTHTVYLLYLLYLTQPVSFSSWPEAKTTVYLSPLMEQNHTHTHTHRERDHRGPLYNLLQLGKKGEKKRSKREKKINERFKMADICHNSILCQVSWAALTRAAPNSASLKY